MRTIKITKKTYANIAPTPANMRLKTMLSIIKDLLKPDLHRKPGRPIPSDDAVRSTIKDMSQSKAVWFGHSTVFLALAGKRFLLDPTFSDSPSPFPLVGGKRFSGKFPVAPGEMPQLDAVIVSHDHYDHLDHTSIMKLNNKTSLFCVPAGVKKRLLKWGIDSEKIREFAWWSELDYDGIKLVCTPARHFSGRTMFDRNSTLWCSWIVSGPNERVFFSGDGGYGPHFKQIGEKYGPFDLTLMECGQYDKRWSAIHMIPEESVQAHNDLQGKVMIPIHWAAFSLALHSWTDPIERVVTAAKQQNVNVSTPLIGQAVIIGSRDFPDDAWWK